MKKKKAGKKGRLSKNDYKPKSIIPEKSKILDPESSEVIFNILNTVIKSDQALSNKCFAQIINAAVKIFSGKVQ